MKPRQPTGMSRQGAKSGQALRLRDRERFAGPFPTRRGLLVSGPVRSAAQEVDEMTNRAWSAPGRRPGGARRDRRR